MDISHLEQCELEYELILRGLLVSEIRQENERRLRYALRNDEKENRDYLSWRGISEECAFIGNRLREIEECIMRQANPVFKSRLYHYYLRLRRCQVQTPNEEENRYVLVDIIKEMLLKYFNELIDNKDELYMAMESHSFRVGRQEVEQARSDQVSNTGTNARPTGAIPKVTNQSRRVAFLSSTRDDDHSVGSNEESEIDDLVVLNSPVVEVENPLYRPTSVPSNAESNLSRGQQNNALSSSDYSPIGHANTITNQARPPVFVRAFRQNMIHQNNFAEPSRNEDFVHVSQIESYVQKYVSTYLGSQMPDRTISNRLDRLTDQLRNVNIQGATGFNPACPSGPIGSTPNSFLPSSSVTRKFSVVPGNLHAPLFPMTSQTSSNMVFNRSAPNPSERPDLDPFQSRNNNNILRNPFDSTPIQNARLFKRLPHHLCKIIGTWPKFCGDNNTVPLVSFLRTIDMLCKSYEVDKEELKPHAHLLFTGDAYTWYTTYVERFTNWDTLLYYLTMRYDNPNRDRYIKEEMRNRKQKPYELFSAFLTEIESLSQRLINPMPDIEKFDLIVENMKISYKRRLALEDIRSIEDLAQKCYRFDALESNLFTPKSRGTNADVHALSAEEEDLEEEYVNAMNVKGSRLIPKQTDNKYPTNQPKTERGTGIVCWNCHGNDHIWKSCPEEKRIFCHVCGYAGKTAFNCPNKHPTNPAFTKESKNGLQENC